MGYEKSQTSSACYVCQLMSLRQNIKKAHFQLSPLSFQEVYLVTVAIFSVLNLAITLFMAKELQK